MPVFFGREDEIVAVRQLLREQAKHGCAFVLVTGASGSGKSSLARAGVLPAIAAHEIDGDVAGWRRAILSPGEGDGHLLLALARALTAENALPALRGDAGALEQLAKDLADGPEMVCRRVLRPALETARRCERLIVLVDQLEELFTDSRITAEAREAFIRALEALARSGCAWVLATVRGDFYAACQSLDAYARMKDAGQFFLVPPGADALDRLIRQPAVLAGLRFEQRGNTALADVILRDATAHRELLPLLEYLLHRLCAERTTEGVLTFASYERLGGVEGALAQRADAVIGELRPSEATLDALISALVTLSGDEQESFVRRRVPRAGLERDEASRALVARLIDERLLTSSAPPGGEASVVVAHEALFRVWTTATAWLGKNREFLRLRANVTQSFTRWREAKEDPAAAGLLLPPGLLLEEARRLLTIEAGRLDPVVGGYIEASIAHHQEQQARSVRRRRLVLASLSLLTVLAVVGAVLAFRNYLQSSYNFAQATRQKERAEAQVAENLKNLHAASMADYAVAVQRMGQDGKWSEGVAHLARALDLEPGNRHAAAFLYSTLSFYAVEKHGWSRAVLGHEDEVISAQFSPDGSRIVTASWDNTARVWDAATGQLLGEPLRHKGVVWSAQFSPDGTRIVTASTDKTAQVWDAATGKPLGEALRHEKEVRSAQFSPDGTRIVTASDDKTARVWDAATGQPLGEPLRHGHGGEVNSAQFSPDGTRVVTASDDKTARVWDATTGKPLGAALRHGKEVRSAQFSPDGSRVVTAGWDKTARVWDAATGQPLGEPLQHEDAVNSAQFSPDGTRIVTASGLMREKFGEARVWDAATGKLLGEPLHHEGAVNSAQFSRDGSRIVTASDDKTARVWDAATGKPLGEALRHGNAVSSAQFSPDGSCIVTASMDWTARVWDAATGKPLGEALPHEGTVKSAQFSSDGSRVVTASGDWTARLWDVVNFTRPPSPIPKWMPERSRAVAGFGFNQDGELQAVPDGERMAVLQQTVAGDDAWIRLVRWLALPAADRTLTPDSHFTRRQIAERERDFGSRGSLKSAIRYDPSVPLARLLLAAFEENPQRAAFLRDYDLKRLPDDSALWTGAVTALAEQKDTERAQRALDKLATLDPDRARTLKTQIGL